MAGVYGGAVPRSPASYVHRATAHAARQDVMCRAGGDPLQVVLCGRQRGQVAWPCGARVRGARRGVQRAGAAAWRVRPGSVWACGRSGERARGERGGAGAGRAGGEREEGARPSGAERAGSGEGWRGRAARQRRREGERKRKEEKEKGKWEREKEKEGRERKKREGERFAPRPRRAVGCVRGSRANRVMDSGVGVGSFGDREIGRKSSELND